MPVAITADQLLARIKARAQVPTAEGRLTDTEILALTDDLILTSLGREVYDADDGRWIKTAPDVTVSSGVATYRLPTRAWGSNVDEVILVDSAGNTTQLDYVDRSDVWEWGTATGVPCAYTLLGSVIQLLPAPSSGGYFLRLRYLRRPSTLALVASCAGISSLTSSVLTLTAPPSTWASISLDVDVVEAVHHGEPLEDDISVTANAGPTTLTRVSGSWTLTGAYAVQGVSNNGFRAYACLAGQSCVVQVPDVAIPYLVDLAARDVCAAFGDNEGAQNSAGLAEQKHKDMAQAIAERSRQRPKIVPRNSPLRVNSIRRWVGAWPWR